jgi:hypothetical protein
MIHEGKEPLDVLSAADRAKLKQVGIIDYHFGKTWITPRALKIIEELEEKQSSHTKRNKI